MSGTRNYFGTDGIRGAFGSATMCEGFARAVGAALARHMKARSMPLPHTVLIGRDTRASGPALTQALAEGLASEGAGAIDAGVAPTPAIALAIPASGATMGIAVTASHNPAADNGIKVFSGQALKLSDAEELEIERHIDGVLANPPAFGKAGARFFDAATLYKRRMAQILPAGSLKGWIVAVDAANGAAAFTTPAVLERLGAAVHAAGVAPDGANINASVGSEHPEVVQALAKSCGARIGIANDGDADRVVLCDETGDILDGDEVLALVGLHLLAKGLLAKNTLVATVMSNLALDEALAKAGGKVVRVDVGDRYILESMLANGFNFGGEASGHIIFRDISTTGDGLLAALEILAILFETGKPLSELRRTMTLWPQKKKNLKVREKKPLGALPGWNEGVAAIERAAKGGRVLVRYSGTEPKIRLLAEARDEVAASAALSSLEALVAQHLEVVK
ncbi:MAG TPA: phosphoglucosamine mutase [Opitutales bacterium]|nr:phosphoglucosamine mutase [Opitutales bacterium]